MTLDNRISLDVITADGQWHKASEDANADLFWALRGGGGNFGVVTSFEFRAHPVGPDVWFAVTPYPMSQAVEVPRVVRDFLHNAPEELGAIGHAQGWGAWRRARVVRMVVGRQRVWSTTQ